MPAPDGANTLIEALRRLDAAGIKLADVALRRPSLDDVFFALTRSPDARPTADCRRDVMTDWTERGRIRRSFGNGGCSPFE